MVWARVGVGGAPGTVYAGGPPGMPLTAQSLYRSWLRVEAAATRGDVPAVPPWLARPQPGSTRDLLATQQPRGHPKPRDDHPLWAGVACCARGGGVGRRRLTRTA
jgi:hypothetical protein